MVKTTGIHIQAILAVENRISLIHEERKGDLCKYVSGILKNNGHVPLSINGMQDHLHIVFSSSLTQSLTELMDRVTQDSSDWINKLHFTPGKFSWQDRYAAFSYSLCEVPRLIHFVQNQKFHHRQKTFQEELRQIADELMIEDMPEDLFHSV